MTRSTEFGCDHEHCGRMESTALLHNAPQRPSRRWLLLPVVSLALVALRLQPTARTSANLTAMHHDDGRSCTVKDGYVDCTVNDDNYDASEENSYIGKSGSDAELGDNDDDDDASTTAADDGDSSTCTSSLLSDYQQEMCEANSGTCISTETVASCDGTVDYGGCGGTTTSCACCKANATTTESTSALKTERPTGSATARRLQDLRWKGPTLDLS